MDWWPTYMDGAMKSLMCSLSVRMLVDAGMRCDVATVADQRSLIRRVKHEGEGFLTMTLPALCQTLESSLAMGRWMHNSAFGHYQGLPRFLSGFLIRLFHTGGMLRDDACPDTLYCLRSILQLWKKVELPCRESRIQAVFDAFVTSNQEVDEDHAGLHPASFELFGHISDILWGRVLRDLDRKVLFRELTPKHGPGATAQRLSGNRKWGLNEWHRRLESDFPAREFLGGYAYWDKSPDATDFERSINFLDPGAERPIRVIHVPKTQKGPRVIGIEPACNQYCQQAILSELVPALESHPWLGIHFTSQLHNRERALLSSRDEMWASLDLKEASDRVHWRLVDRMLEKLPSLNRALFSCRSNLADVPGHGVVQLNRFASMGSAVCFPVEAMVFYTLVLVARIALSQGADSSLSSINFAKLRKLGRGLLVYGDDLFVPTNEATGIVAVLEDFGLRVNRQKSFWTGKFRESCGMDAYNGVEVTPTRCKHPFPRNTRDVSQIVGWTAFGNRLWKQGWWSTASMVRSMVESITGPLPLVHSASPMIGWHSFEEFQSVSRWSKRWSRFETRGPLAKGRRERCPLSGRSALVKCLTTTVGSSAVQVNHLEYHDRRGAESIKLHWSPLY